MEDEELQKLLFSYKQYDLTRALQKAESFDFFFNTSLFGFAEVSSEGVFINANEALCKILKISMGELIGSTFTKITPEPMLSIDMANVDLLKQGKKREYILPKFYKLENGEFIFVIIHPVSVRDPLKNFVKFYVVILPVDEETYIKLQMETMNRVLMPDNFVPKSTTSTIARWLSYLTKFISKYLKEIATIMSLIGFATYLMLKMIANDQEVSLGSLIDQMLF